MGYKEHKKKKQNIVCSVDIRVMQIIICRIWGSHSSGYEEFYLLEYNAV
jgi:hypothetical protein